MVNFSGMLLVLCNFFNPIHCLFLRVHNPSGSVARQLSGCLDDTLCEQYERTVSADNCVRFETLNLQIPADRHRCRYVKAKVRLHRYASGALAVFHGPRKLAGYNPEGKTIIQNVQHAA